VASQVTTLLASTVTNIDEISGTESAQNMLNLAMLGISDADIKQAQADMQEANSLIAQAAATSDPALQKQLLMQAADLQQQVLNSMPEIEVTATSTATTTTSSSSLQQALSSATSSEAKAALQSIQSQLPESTTVISVTRELKSYEITNKEKTNTTVEKTKIDLVITVTTAMQNVTIVETISKSVAQDISAVLFPGEQPSILQADPIVSWTFPTIIPGETKDMSYVVNGKVETLNSTTVAGGSKVAAVTPTTCTTTCPSNYTQAAYPSCLCTAPTPTPTPTNLTQIIIIVALLVIIAIAIIMLGKGKGGKTWKAHKAKVKAMFPFLPI